MATIGTPTIGGGAAPAPPLPARSARSQPYEHFAGICALAAGLSGFSYAVSFIVLRNAGLSGLFLLLGGLSSTAALIAVYERLQGVDASFALLGTALSVTGAIGAVLHGGYDLANAIMPPTMCTTPEPAKST